MSLVPMGRLAFREEGKFWNAYYAQPNTMENAIFIGSIQLRFVHDKKRKKLFMRLMRDAVSDIIEEVSGVRPTWPEPEGHDAPEHERTKRA